jgi:hypothetical protein
MKVRYENLIPPGKLAPKQEKEFQAYMTLRLAQRIHGQVVK